MQLSNQHGYIGRIRYFDNAALLAICPHVLPPGFDRQEGTHRPWVCVKVDDATRMVWFMLTRQERDDIHGENVRYSLDHRHFDGGRQYTEESFINDANSYVVLSAKQVMATSRPPMWEDERRPTRLNKDGMERLAHYLEVRLPYTEDRGCHEELRRAFVVPLIAKRRLLEANRRELQEREARRGSALEEFVQALKLRKEAARREKDAAANEPQSAQLAAANSPPTALSILSPRTASLRHDQQRAIR